MCIYIDIGVCAAHLTGLMNVRCGPQQQLRLIDSAVCCFVYFYMHAYRLMGKLNKAYICIYTYMHTHIHIYLCT